MEVAFNDVSRAVVDYLQHTDTRAGVMVLIDMGYTKEIADALLSVINGPLVVVDNVTTRMALNVASEIALGKTSNKSPKRSCRLISRVGMCSGPQKKRACAAGDLYYRYRYRI